MTYRVPASPANVGAGIHNGSKEIAAIGQKVGIGNQPEDQVDSLSASDVALASVIGLRLRCWVHKPSKLHRCTPESF